MQNGNSDKKQLRRRKPNNSKPQANRGRGGGGGGRGGFKKSTLNPELLIKEAEHIEVKDFRADRTFDDMPLSPELKSAIKNKGFERPSEIQDRTLESLLEGRNLLGIAQTGTGKTGAFLIPIIEHLLFNDQKPFALIVAPTRELALQIEEEFKSMSKGLRLFSQCFIGGTNINRDMMNLRRKSHIVIATPGRLLDLVNRKAVNLGEFNTLVLDEFDRMLDMGFVNDVKKIINGMHKRKHTLLFSATLDKSQKKLIDEILINPITVKVSQGDSTGEHIDQDIIRVGSGQDKFQILFDMLSDPDFEKVLIFEETKHKANKLCKQLNSKGISSDQIHGNKSQNARQKALKSFKEGNIRVLVATDVAARGIDVSDVSHVINYQVPQTMDSYIHRIGRTGRAGKGGKAFTFVD